MKVADVPARGDGVIAKSAHTTGFAPTALTGNHKGCNTGRRVDMDAGSGPRVLLLFLRQRSVGWGVLVLALFAGALLLLGDWVTNPQYATRVTVMLVAAPVIVACVVGVSAWAPSADLELASSFPMVWLRLVHLVGLLLFGIIASVLVVNRWPVEIPGDVSLPGVWVRNAIGLSGLALLTARWLHPRVSWLGPCLLAVMMPVIVLRLPDDPATFVNEQFQPDWWVFLGHDQGSVVSWGMAIGLLVVGMMVLGLWGPKVEEGEG